MRFFACARLHVSVTREDDAVDEKLRLRDVYDEKAATFSGSRGGPWSYVEGFCRGREGDVAVDLGCGAGRHLPLLEGFERVVGLDFSREMLDEARRYAGDGVEFDLLKGDLEKLPLETQAFDLAVYVAGLHHLPSRSARLRSLRELNRVLSDDGVGLLSVWAIQHPRFEGEREDIRASDGDYYVSIGDRTRFYHIYGRRELRRDLDESPLETASLELVDGNYYAVVSPG